VSPKPASHIQAQTDEQGASRQRVTKNLFPKPDVCKSATYIEIDEDVDAGGEDGLVDLSVSGDKVRERVLHEPWKL